jgi:D-alanyl-D-alanine carboxypeptidase
MFEGTGNMLERVLPFAAVTAVVILLSNPSSKAEDLYGREPNNLKERLGSLVRSYPDFIASYDDKFLILKDGTKFQISDGKTNKTFEELLEKPDIDDMFYIPYPAGRTPQQPAKNSDPGRVRFGPLFVAMYGDCKNDEVVKKLRTIDWLPKHGGGRVSISTSNGVDRGLQAVSKELDELPDDLMKYLKPTSGTYNCRNIAGSDARSMHAYGAAIDINTKYSAYWRWSSKNGSDPKWQNQIPVEIVHVFEKHGFIWGGYWYHYDTMHFEYRPELLPAYER